MQKLRTGSHNQHSPRRAGDLAHPDRGWSVTQEVVTTSSGESEFYGLVRGAIESQFIAHLLEFFDHKVEQIVEMDSTAAKGAAQRQGVGRRMKHITTDKLFVQNLVSEGILKLRKVHKDVNVADLGTKYVDKRTQERLVKLLGAFWLQTAIEHELKHS